MAARLPYLEHDQVPPGIQRVYDSLVKTTGRVLNIWKLMAHPAVVRRQTTLGNTRTPPR